jgi:hypothetical protein
MIWSKKASESYPLDRYNCFHRIRIVRANKSQVNDYMSRDND